MQLRLVLCHSLHGAHVIYNTFMFIFYLLYFILDLRYIQLFFFKFTFSKTYSLQCIVLKVWQMHSQGSPSTVTVQNSQNSFRYPSTPLCNALYKSNSSPNLNPRQLLIYFYPCSFALNVI